MAAVGDVTGGDVSVDPHSQRSMRRRAAYLRFGEAGKMRPCFSHSLVDCVQSGPKRYEWASTEP